MGSVLGQYAPEWIWMGPSRNRLMIRKGLEPPGRIWEVSVGSRKNGKSDKQKETEK